MAKQDDYARYTVRLPADLYKRVQAHAEANERSANAEIISLLDMALWEADWARMESGLEPLRETTPEERDMIERNRAALKRRAAALSETGGSAATDDLSLLDDIDILQSKFKEVVDGLQRLSSTINPDHKEDKD